MPGTPIIFAHTHRRAKRPCSTFDPKLSILLIILSPSRLATLCISNSSERATLENPKMLGYHQRLAQGVE